jgi:hypothetical protein
MEETHARQVANVTINNDIVIWISGIEGSKSITFDDDGSGTGNSMSWNRSKADQRNRSSRNYCHEGTRL